MIGSWKLFIENVKDLRYRYIMLIDKGTLMYRLGYKTQHVR